MSGDLIPLGKETLLLRHWICVKRLVMMHVYDDVQVVLKCGVDNLLYTIKKCWTDCIGCCSQAARVRFPTYRKTDMVKSQHRNEFEVFRFPRISPFLLRRRLETVAHVDSPSEAFVHFKRWCAVLCCG